MSDIRVTRVPSYQRRIGVFWWVHKRSYFLFVMRELSSLFVAWFVVYLLMFIAAVGGGEETYESSSTARPARCCWS